MISNNDGKIDIDGNTKKVLFEWATPTQAVAQALSEATGREITLEDMVKSTVGELRDADRSAT